LSTKRCSQCGATVELAEDASSATCAFCDSTLVAHEEQGEPPDRAATFAVPRERAGLLLAGFLQGSWLAPEALRRASKPEELRSVMVPFYAYDAIARSEFRCSVGIYWWRTETYTTMVNGKMVTRTRRVRETEWQPLSGTHGRRWHDHLVSASRGLSEAEANELEPFDLGRALAFAPALTAGLEAEHPTIPHDEARHTAHAELARLETQTIAKQHLPGDTHRALTSSTEVEIEAVRLVLLPVWISVYRGPAGAVRLLVNGQTGEVVGSVPRSKMKIGCLVGLALVALLAVLAALGGLAGIGALVGALS
jgi:hypothetical protein